jgi:hypothetical protein
MIEMHRMLIGTYEEINYLGNVKVDARIILKWM